MLRFDSSRFGKRLLARLLVALLAAASAFAQTTVGTGSIVGTVTDVQGAVLAGARVEIADKATGQVISVTTGGAGSYTSGPLVPADYAVKVAAKGFSSVSTVVTVTVGSTSTENVKLQVGQESTVIEVQGAAVTVNTEQAQVQGTIGTEQIENLPVNGRNFLDLAQLEPGVQIQEGSTFDPTKNGFSSISFGGRFGRTARVEVDGVDVSDETVGTTTQNIPASAIQEFQLGESSLDISTELTSSGSVNVVTRSGTNQFHGEAFGYYRNINAGMAALPGGQTPPFEREQFGGNFGGAIIKDKLFFFVDAERSRQDLTNPVQLGGAFAGLSAPVGEPFRELETTDRIDYTISHNARAFYRYSYDQNNGVRPFGAGPSFQPFLNRTYTPSNAVGVDWTTGSFTHAFRFEYLKFRNEITDGSQELSGQFNPIPTASINIGGGPNEGFGCQGGSVYCSGPNPLAPQQTYQSDHQIKYDGSKLWGTHVIRYGGSFNHILGGGFASFFALTPTLGDGSTNNFTSTFPGGGTNPLNYPVTEAVIGNGQGFSTEIPQFGFPAGGQHDNRVGIYIADAWKIRPNFTFTYGLRWLRDTGRTDSDLAPIPCSEATFITCTGNLLDQWGPGLGNSVNQPNTNFAPQLGFAWDPAKTGKTVIRGGIGLYYENAIFNNVLFDRPPKLQTGLFLSYDQVCSGGADQPFAWPSNPGPAGTSIAGGAGTSNGSGQVLPTWCGEPVGTAAGPAYALEQAYQAAAKAAGPASNSSFIGNLGTVGPADGDSILSPNYKTPRSVQMNIGIQREVHSGTVLTVDYLRNVSTRTTVGVDQNHGGDVSTLNPATAAADRDAAQTAAGCPTGSGQGGCMVTSLGSATNALLAYGSAGIGGPTQVFAGLPGSLVGVNYAFPGRNPSVGELLMGLSEGRSVYNGLDVSLKQQTRHVGIPGVKSANFQVSYSLSRYVSQFLDSDFVNTALDFNNPDRFTGPNALDRTHQFTVGGTFDLPAYLRLGFIGHFFSPLPQTLTLPANFGGASILVSDVTGDGTPGDPLPGTNVGSYMRGISPGNSLNALISNYNSTHAGQPTPAGAALISNGIFTANDLATIGGVQQPLAAPIADVAGLSWLKTFDVNLGWTYTVKERIKIEPTIGIFNIFNFANFDLPGAVQGGALGLSSASVLSGPVFGGSPTQSQGTVGGTSANITDPLTYRTNRASLQSGTNALGAPRALEYGLKISF